MRLQIKKKLNMKRTIFKWKISNEKQRKNTWKKIEHMRSMKEMKKKKQICKIVKSIQHRRFARLVWHIETEFYRKLKQYTSGFMKLWKSYRNMNYLDCICMGKK